MVDATKLSGSFVANVGPNVVAIRTVNVQQPDGRMVQVQGNFDVRVSLRNGDVRKFSAPVDIQPTPDGLVFRGGNEAPLEAKADDIQAVEVSQMNQGKTVALGVLGGLALAALVVGVTFAAIGASGAANPAPEH